MKKTPLALCALLALPAFAAHSAYHQELLKHWQVSKEFTLAVADLMPAASYDFKPNAEEMSFGELMVHIGDANTRNFALVSGTQAVAKPAKTDKEAAMKFLAESFDHCIRSLENLAENKLDAMSGPEGRQLTGRERLWSYFTHTAHHRGQAEVYLRVKNIKPPAYRF